MQETIVPISRQSMISEDAVQQLKEQQNGGSRMITTSAQLLCSFLNHALAQALFTAA